MRAHTKIQRLVPLAAAIVTATGSAAQAQTFTPTLPALLDRWVYPFGDQDGQRTTIPLFTTLGSGYTGFDDKDAQALIGFATAPAVPQVSPARYSVTSATLRVYIVLPSGQPGFIYDPTYDAAETYVPGGPTPDADAGRPVEVYAAAYRGGFTSLTFAEDSPFATGEPVVSPARANRNVYPTDFGGLGGEARDVSNNVTDYSGAPATFDVSPLALGVATGVASADFLTLDPPPAPGAPVPTRTLFTFSLDVSRPEVQAYLRDGLSLGRVNLVVTSMAPASAFGAGPITYPVLYSQENALGRGAELLLSVDVQVACNRADITDTGDSGAGPDGQLELDDILAFVNDYNDAAGCPGTPPCSRADITDTGDSGAGADGQLTLDDILAFVNAYNEGC